MKLERGAVRGEHVVPRLCGMVGVRGVITIAAKSVAKAAGDLDLVGGVTPQAVAAAAILLVCSCCRAGAWRERGEAGRDGGGDEDEVLAPAAVAQAAGITEMAIGRPYRSMHEFRERLLTENTLKGIKSKGLKVADLPCVL